MLSKNRVVTGAFSAVLLCTLVLSTACSAGQRVATADVSTEGRGNQTSADESADKPTTATPAAAVDTDAQLAAMKEKLLSLPVGSASFENADEDGIFVESLGTPSEKSIQLLDEFLAATERGEAAELITVRFTTEGDPMLYYVVFDGTQYLFVADFSRDKFSGGEASGVRAYLKVYDIQDDPPDGQTFRHVLLTDTGYQTLNRWTFSDSDILLLCYK